VAHMMVSGAIWKCGRSRVIVAATRNPGAVERDPGSQRVLDVETEGESHLGGRVDDARQAKEGDQSDEHAHYLVTCCAGSPGSVSLFAQRGDWPSLSDEGGDTDEGQRLWVERPIGAGPVRPCPRDGRVINGQAAQLVVVVQVVLPFSVPSTLAGTHACQRVGGLGKYLLNRNRKSLAAPRYAHRDEPLAVQRFMIAPSLSKGWRRITVPRPTRPANIAQSRNSSSYDGVPILKPLGSYCGVPMAQASPRLCSPHPAVGGL
jgi:hypothetical protein